MARSRRPIQQPRNTEKIVWPLPKGQVTIPVEFRRFLGITGSTPLRVTLDPQRRRIELKPLIITEALEGVRDYTDDEIEEFLQSDRIAPETAAAVRRLLAVGRL